MSSCLFCDIVAGQIPADQVFSDDEFLAFKDIDPKAPTHILLIPRRHISRLTDLAPGDDLLMGRFILTAKKIAEDLGLAAAGYRLVFNCGTNGGQTVEHIHLHILGGRPLTWPPG